MNNINSSETTSVVGQKINYLKFVKVFLSRWYWIAGSVLIALALGYTYLWYTPPTYQTSGSLKFDEAKSEFTELLSGSSNLYDRTNKISSEGYVIQSREILLNAVSRINYKISFYLVGRIRNTDIYPQQPFLIEILSQDSINFHKGLFTIQRTGKDTYSLRYNMGEDTRNTNFKFGNIVEAPGVAFRVKSSSAATNAEYSFKFNSREDFLSRVTGHLNTTEAFKYSNIMLLSLTDRNPLFAQDMLNAIMTEYVTSDVKRSTTSASQTINFIDLQLGFLYDKVQKSGQEVVSYKSRHNLIDISANTATTLDKLTLSKADERRLELEDIALKQLEEQVQNNQNIALNYALETSLGGDLSALVTRLNDRIVEKEKKSTLLLPNSEVIRLLDKQISEEKKSVLNAIKLLREKHEETKKFVRNQVAVAESEIRQIPGAERDFAKLQAEYDINQKVFSYLSEKKLEAEIHRAAVVAGARIVDQPISTWIVAPNRGNIYTLCAIFGIAGGIGLILLVRFLNPYIYDKETVESLTTIPIIGVIRKFPGFIDQDNRQALSLQKPKSVFAESLRSVRTNISFLGADKDSKIICITSEVSGEGKSFVSVNLSSTLALIDKKTVLVGADLRRSKLHRTFDVDNRIGLSSYLANQITLDEITHKTSLEYLDFIPSGPVPPNPSELLHSQRMRDLLDELKKKYDYILVDTAPVGLVSDSIPLIRDADINLYIIRSGASKFSAATIPNRIAHEYNLNNVSIVLNAFDENKLHARYYTSDYAAGYSQYYYSDYSAYSSSEYYTHDAKKSNWWEIWKKN